MRRPEVLLHSRLKILGKQLRTYRKPQGQKYKDLPWNDMARMRDKIAHFYFGIDYKIVWAVVKK